MSADKPKPAGMKIVDATKKELMTVSAIERDGPAEEGVPDQVERFAFDAACKRAFGDVL